MTRAVQWPAIRTVTNRKIVYLFASHASGDHSTGAWHFRDDKPVYIADGRPVRAIAAER